MEKQSHVRQKHTRKQAKSSTKIRRKALSVECLETRRVFATLGMTNTAVLDFDGEFLNQAQLTKASSWDMDDFNNVSNGWVSFSSFHSLFTSSRPNLDVNGDGVTDGDDADLAVEMIADKVRQDFAPYDLNIVVGDQDDHRDMFQDNIVGDALAIISGGVDNTNFRPGRPAGGWASYDPGNTSDGLGLVFTQSRANWMNATRFVNSVARTISHELGHSFGLRHQTGDPSGDTDAPTHSIMMTGDIDGDGTLDRDDSRDYSFHDRSYDTERSGNPQDPQNAHAVLSSLNVLGPSNRAWMAVLRPGTLTISGNSGNNTIRVSPQDADTWNVLLVGQNTLVDVNSIDTNSLNPFDASLSVINIFGKGGNDTIRVYNVITASLVADGGSGNDVIHGGGGNDILRGGSGNDTIYGRDGLDQLFGELGNDFLDGGNSRDWLYGGFGFDRLFGRAGNDYLDGGLDGIADDLFGGAGGDLFRREMYFDFLRFSLRNRDEPADFDPSEGDVLL